MNNVVNSVGLMGMGDVMECRSPDPRWANAGYGALGLTVGAGHRWAIEPLECNTLVYSLSRKSAL